MISSVPVSSVSSSGASLESHKGVVVPSRLTSTSMTSSVLMSRGTGTPLKVMTSSCGDWLNCWPLKGVPRQWMRGAPPKDSGAPANPTHGGSERWVDSEIDCPWDGAAIAVVGMRRAKGHDVEDLLDCT